MVETEHVIGMVDCASSPLSITISGCYKRATVRVAVCSTNFAMCDNAFVAHNHKSVVSVDRYLLVKASNMYAANWESTFA
jgi:uncharacterized protein YigE (DUF2233 family)